MYAKPTEFLAEIDSHGIYNARMLDDCEFDTSAIAIYDPETVAGMIKARGLGGNLVVESDDDRLFNGWQAAEALARSVLGTDPGARYQGRGSIFRACVTALESAGH